MAHAPKLWSIRHALLKPFAWAFTRPSHRRFVAGITALAWNVEEHTLTPSVRASERPADGKAMETFAVTGSGRGDLVTRILAGLVVKAPGRIGHGAHASAVEDTKVHRSGADVWGTCTVPEATARGPQRAPTVRAHHGVVLGALLDHPDPPAWFLPLAGRLADRTSQWPSRSGSSGAVEVFRTTCEWAVDWLREPARDRGGKHRAAFDGGCAPAGVVRPVVAPEDGSHRIEFLTRWRHEARWPAPLPARHRAHPKWGPKWSPPRPGGRWAGPWPEGPAVISGRRRKVTRKEVVCLWRVSGHDVPVKAVVATVEGPKKRFTLVSSAVELTGLPLVELIAARSRPEDALRDQKQRLGWEEWRAWTRNPMERTSPAPWVTMSLLRLARFGWESEGEVDWWYRPPWDRKKDRPSVLDVERLFRRHRGEMRHFLSQWLRAEGAAA